MIQLPRLVTHDTKNDTHISFPRRLGRSQLPANYKLMSVISHYGGSNGGHYKTFINRNDKWLVCDDDFVLPVDDDKVVRKSIAPIM